MWLANAWAVALHEVDRALVEIKAQYPRVTAVVTAGCVYM